MTLENIFQHSKSSHVLVPWLDPTLSCTYLLCGMQLPFYWLFCWPFASCILHTAYLMASLLWLASTNREMFQEAINSLVALLDRVGLRTNTSKTKGETCVPGRIRTRLLNESYTRSRADFTTQSAWDQCRVECDKYGLEMLAASLSHHLETKHGVYRSKVIDQDLLIIEQDPVTYHAMGSADGKFYCPVPGCVGEAASKWVLRRHFCDCHPHDLSSIPGEGVYLKCDRCQMQVNPSACYVGHRHTEDCQVRMERTVQQQAAVECALSLWMSHLRPIERSSKGLRHSSISDGF